MKIILCLIGVISIIEGVVLDPALYLSPSPPLTTTHNNKAEEMWSQTAQSKSQGVNKVTSSIEEDTDKTSTEPSEALEPAETFWHSYRPTSLRGIHIPLTFHLTGTYGGNSGKGVLTSGYMNVADSYGNRGNAGLAGSGYRSYGTPGVRVYGNDQKPAWGGWGNGKWGHYGKG